MRQRNAGAHPLTVMTDPPCEVAPGEVVDFDEPLAGFEPADDNNDDSVPAEDSSKSARGRKAKAGESAGGTEEVTK